MSLASRKVLANGAVPVASFPLLVESKTDEFRLVRAIRRARRRRTEFFNGKLFSEPAWDILLELYATHLEQRRISVSSVCHATEVPGTTGLRWLDALLREGLIEKSYDPLDGRRIYVGLSQRGLRAMSAYFAAMPTDLRGYAQNQ